jgi:RNA polymerase sigma-70 factor (ECF subfamily)
VPESAGPIERFPDREWVRAALAELPPFQRLALTLRYLDGLTVAEIAAALGRSEHAVESLLARGRVALRSLLRDPEETS